jgi:hypothetical protein
MSLDPDDQEAAKASSIPAWRRRLGLTLLILLPIAGLLLSLCQRALQTANRARPATMNVEPQIVSPDDDLERCLNEVKINLGLRLPLVDLLEPSQIESLPGGDDAPQWRLAGQYSHLADESAAGTWNALIHRGERGTYDLWYLRYSEEGITRHWLRSPSRAFRREHRVESDTANRVIAEFVLEQGSTVDILSNGEPEVIHDMKDLPVEPFTLRDTDWADAEQIRIALGPLNEWVGKWDIVTTCKPDRWDPNERTLRSKLVVRQLLGGRFLAVYPFQELGYLQSLSVITFDVDREELRRWSCQDDGWVDESKGNLDAVSRELSWTFTADTRLVMRQTWQPAGPDKIEGTNVLPALKGEMALDSAFSMCREGEPSEWHPDSAGELRSP